MDVTPGSVEWCRQRIITESKIGSPTVKPFGTVISPSLTVGLAHIASPDTGEVLLHPNLVTLMDSLLITAKQMPNILAGYMTPAYRAQRSAAGLEPTVALSPYEVGSALQLAPLGGSAVSMMLQRQILIAANAAKIPVPDMRATGSYMIVSYTRHLFVPSGGLVSSPLTWEGLAPETRTMFSSWINVKNLGYLMLGS